MTKKSKSRANSRSLASTVPPQQPQPPLTPIPGTSVVPEAVYRNDHHPKLQGPWAMEADKIAWTDPDSKLDCIILREHGGELGSYVGVPPEHPLFGYRAEALPAAIGEDLHRPIGYARRCDRRTPERRSICHVTPGSQAADHALAETSEEAWWLGMVFDGPRDLVPLYPKAILGAERGQIYRDQSFAFEQATLLAQQLHAFAQGKLGSEPGWATPGALPTPKGEDQR